MANMVNLIIDDQAISVPAGTLIVDAAKMHGNDIPIFCYHPKMEPVGMCRMCLVEIGRPVVDRATGQPQLNEDGTPKIQFGPKLDTACTTPVSEGMVVRTVTDKVIDARREVLEFLLTSHPLDCPICDKGGECPLQNLTMRHGPGRSRFLLDDKIHLAKHMPLGELIYLDRERCIQCARCIRFQSDIAGDPVIAFSQRGRSLEIITNSEPGFDSYFSGNTTDICPVGALTTADFRFAARPWELKHVASICTQCPVGCNLTVDVRREAVTTGASVIRRVMPRQNEEVNEIWICDKGRWAYHYSEDPDRLVQPLLRKNGELAPATWDEALDVIAAKLRDSGENLLALVGGRLPNEDLFNIGKLANLVGGKTALYTDIAGGEWVSRMGLPPGSNIGTMGPETAVLVVASDLEEEGPIWYLRLRAAAKRGAKLIVANPRYTKLDDFAAHALRYAYGEETALVRSFADSGADDAVKAAAEALAGAENLVIFYGSEGMDLAGTRALADTCAALLINSGKLGRPNNGIVGVWHANNQQGAYDLGFAPVDDLAGAIHGAGAVLIAAADLAGDNPLLADALGGRFVVVQELFLTETARMADVVLPVQSFVEREGTFTSGERRVQRFYPAVAPFAGPMPDYRIASEIASRLGHALEGRVASLVFQRIAAEVPDYADLNYQKLAEVRDQWPIVHREDMYYGGTSYHNHQGLGVQLQPGMLSGRWEPSMEGKAQAGQHATRNARYEVSGGSVLLVPVTRLYDRGNMVLPSLLLHARLARPEIRLHPQTAGEFSMAENDAAAFPLADGTATVQVKLDDRVPQGVGLIPRSVGIPLVEPLVVKLERMEQQIAD